ncbi:hypothetical protein L950_0223375 [Sphingobacterium sp. IITKGP-BTPF85]|nr:hypothetical protein L950_0223375 [Sphingobacterium sp. IITKGP-BTPF85]
MPFTLFNFIREATLVLLLLRLSVALILPEPLAFRLISSIKSKQLVNKLQQQIKIINRENDLSFIIFYCFKGFAIIPANYRAIIVRHEIFFLGS